MTTTPSSRARRFRNIFVLILSLFIFFSLGCRGEPQVRSPRDPIHPVMLVGIDGLEWNTVLRLIERGRMPTFAALMKRGVAGELTVTKPTLSPIIWTSIATGVGSRKHGIRGFVHGSQTTTDDAGGTAALYTSNDRRVKAFWNILSDAGRRVHTIGWWLSYPVEQINGVMVAQVNTITPALRRSGQGIWKGSLVEGLEDQVHPPSREASLLALIPRVEADAPGLVRTIFGDIPAKRFPTPAAMMDQSLWAFRADALYHRVALDVLQNDRPFDLLAVYLGGADVVGHRFWRHAHPDLYDVVPDEQERIIFGHILDDYYAYLDSVLASFVQAAPADANILVVSDHGMTAIRRSHRFRKPALSGGHLSGPPALFVAAGPDVRESGELSFAAAGRPPLLGSILDVTPTILALLEIPTSADMDGSPLLQVFDPPFLEYHPIGRIARHTEPDWYAARPKPEIEDQGAGERLEQLRALGYLED